MSHFTLLVIGDDIKTQMAPFDENLETPGVITTEELIAKSRKEVEDYRIGRYAEFIENPEEYKKSAFNPNHIKYIEEEFPLKLEWTDEQHLKSVHEWYEPEDINKDGSVNTTYNINSKWDWYQLGGRWTGLLTLKPNQRSGKHGERSLLGSRPQDMTKFDSALVKDIDWTHEDMKNFGTYAVLKDGEWCARGDMAWFGISYNEVDDWDKQFKKLIEDLDPETRISILDCHI